MIEYNSILKWAVAIVLIAISGIWFINYFVIESKRDLHSLSLNAQSNIESVRKEHETAIYRNLLVPPSFPLTTGLNLSIGYRLRNGNFADLWSAIMENGKDRKIQFYDDEVKLALINGKAKALLHRLNLDSFEKIGIVHSIDTVDGFTLFLSGLLGSIHDIIPWFLNSIPRKNLGIDVLFVENWNSVKYLNGSETWYKWIVVCEDDENDRLESNVVSLSTFIGTFAEDQDFKYDPKDASDDSKTLAYITNTMQETTSFTQMCLVSSVSAFIKSFPLDHEISKKDHLTICTNSHWRHGLAIQVWTKLLAVLLHGGSASFQRDPISLKNLHQGTTLLMISGDASLLSHILSQSKGFWTSLSRSLLSEGVFNKLGQISHTINNMRCIYILNEVRSLDQVTNFELPVPKLIKSDLPRFTSSQLTSLRSLFGARVVMELYAPYAIMGAIAYSNYYDYRVFPKPVDELFTCYGSLSTSLEGKLVETKRNPDLLAVNRQGMLVIRGFTIGKPVEKERLDHAIQLLDQFDGGEGWMPLLGVFGIFGKDGCFYEYK